MTRWLALAGLTTACTPPANGELANVRALAELRPAVDLDPDPNVVEVELVAEIASVEYLPGVATEVWAYRDAGVLDGSATVPGPLLTATVGQRLVVHVRNELPEGTTVHWHGLRLREAMDGNPMVSGAIAPGESFTYDIALRDPGLHWYHPHVHADEQIQRGLQGPLLVRAVDEPRVSGERVLVLDDIGLAEDGALLMDPTDDDVMYGRRGNVLLVNGGLAGAAAAAAGAVERWRLVNTSNGRFFTLALADLPLRVIGWDGGAVAEPYETDALTIAPGERYDVLVALDAEPGDRLALETRPRSGDGSTVDDGPYTLLTLTLDEPVDELLAKPEPVVGSITPLPIEPDTAVRRFELDHRSSIGPGATFTINGQRWPLNTPIHVTYGETEIWELLNLGGHEHPFHLHGMSFQVLDRDGVGEPTLGWKDTVQVAPYGTTRIAVRYDEPGMWMFHCTIPEHAERGMMGDLHVMEEGE